MVTLAVARRKRCCTCERMLRQRSSEIERRQSPRCVSSPVPEPRGRSERQKRRAAPQHKTSDGYVRRPSLQRQLPALCCRRCDPQQHLRQLGLLRVRFREFDQGLSRRQPLSTAALGWACMLPVGSSKPKAFFSQHACATPFQTANRLTIRRLSWPLCLQPWPGSLHRDARIVRCCPAICARAACRSCAGFHPT